MLQPVEVFMAAVLVFKVSSGSAVGVLPSLQ